jgi:hypothetical protein
MELNSKRLDFSKDGIRTEWGKVHGEAAQMEGKKDYYILKKRLEKDSSIKWVLNADW